jgi:hypothetical protein
MFARDTGTDKTRRRALRQEIRNGLGVSSSPAPSPDQLRRAAIQLDQLFQLTCGLRLAVIAPADGAAVQEAGGINPAALETENTRARADREREQRERMLNAGGQMVRDAGPELGGSAN